MAGKAYWTTTILADKRYSNIITNGDLAPGFYNPETGEPVPHLPDAEEEKKGLLHVFDFPCDFHGSSFVGGFPAVEDCDVDRHYLTYYNHDVNMSPYIFFLGCGHYTTYRQWVRFLFSFAVPPMFPQLGPD